MKTKVRRFSMKLWLARMLDTSYRTEEESNQMVIDSLRSGWPQELDGKTERQCRKLGYSTFPDRWMEVK